VRLRTRLAPGRLVLGALGLAIGVGGVLLLREATLSTHGEDVAARIELVVSAQTEGGERTQSLGEMVEAQIMTCRLEVTSDVVGPIEDLGGGRFRAVLAPSLDHTNRKQFRGCLEDWVIDHVQLQVVHLDEAEPDDEEPEPDEPDSPDSPDDSHDADDRRRTVAPQRPRASIEAIDGDPHHRYGVGPG
jgi:hypothetical protein